MPEPDALNMNRSSPESRDTAPPEGRATASVPASFTMPPETAPQSRVWMAFPRAGATLGAGAAERAAGYAAWTAVAHAVADWVPVTMIVDPTETARARHMLSRGIESIEQPI
ncbi:MAG: agmatine deiminase family protein, partial [Gammaproteobacteria bacterium]